MNCKLFFFFTGKIVQMCKSLFATKVAWRANRICFATMKNGCWCIFWFESAIVNLCFPPQLMSKMAMMKYFMASYALGGRGDTNGVLGYSWRVREGEIVIWYPNCGNPSELTTVKYYHPSYPSSFVTISYSMYSRHSYLFKQKAWNNISCNSKRHLWLA